MIKAVGLDLFAGQDPNGSSSRVAAREQHNRKVRGMSQEIQNHRSEAWTAGLSGAGLRATFFDCHGLPAKEQEIGSILFPAYVLVEADGLEPVAVDQVAGRIWKARHGFQDIAAMGLCLALTCEGEPVPGRGGSEYDHPSAAPIRAALDRPLASRTSQEGVVDTSPVPFKPLV